MATESLLPNGDDGGWTTGGFADVDELVSSPDDGNFIQTAADGEGEQILFDLSASAIEDGDTVTRIEVNLRARFIAGGPGTIGVELLIGGVVQGGQIDSSALTSSFADSLLINDVAWNVDRTAAEMDGAQIRIDAKQSGMPVDTQFQVSALDVVVTFTPAGAGNISELPSQAITVTPFVPTIDDGASTGEISELPSQAITVTPFVPTVEAFQSQISELPSQAITVTPFVPTVVVADNQISELPSQAITLVPQVPDVVATEFASPTVCRVSFPTPTNPPLDGAGLQIFRWFLRKDAAHVGGTGTPTAAFFLYEAGVQRQVLTSGVSITSDSGQLVEVTWDSVNLVAGNGADVEARMVATVGGSGSNARTIEVGAVEWCADPDLADFSNTSQLPVRAITLTPNVPSVVATENRISQLPVQAITVVPNVPTVVSTDFNISSLPSQAITVVPNVPTVVSTDFNISSLPVQAITLTPNVPTVVATDQNTSELPVQAIAVTPFVPTVVSTDFNTSALPSQAITVTPFVPTVESFDSDVSQLPSIAITLTPFVPLVITDDLQTVLLPAHVITLVPKVPVIIVATPCDEVLAPNVLLEQINASGDVTDIDESVAAPDGNWLVSP